MYIALCNCNTGLKRGTQIKKEGIWVQVKDIDGFCPFCKHSVYWKRVVDTWKPEDGLVYRYKWGLCIGKNLALQKNKSC